MIPPPDTSALLVPQQQTPSSFHTRSNTAHHTTTHAQLIYICAINSFMHLTLTISQKERFPLPTSEQCPGTSSSALLQAFMKFLFSYREHPVCIQKKESILFRTDLRNYAFNTNLNSMSFKVFISKFICEF